MTMRLPFDVCIVYCGTSVAFTCFAQVCRSVSKGETDRAFVCDSVLFVLLQRGVVISDCFMVGFEIEFRHAGIITHLARINQAENIANICQRML